MSCSVCNKNYEVGKVSWIDISLTCDCGDEAVIVDARALYDGLILDKGHSFLFLIPKICPCGERIQQIHIPCEGLAGILFANVGKRELSPIGENDNKSEMR